MDAGPDIGHRVSEGIPAQYHGANPQNATADVEGDVACIGHFRRARDRGAKRSNDGNEPREDNGTATIFFVEIVGALKMAAAKEKGVFAAIEGGSRGPSDPVADLIADDGAKHDREKEPFEGNSVRQGGENAGSDEQGITREKEAHKKAGFDKNDDADKRGAAGAD